MTARRTDSGLDGILLVDKPAAWTSHDVVAKARSILRQRRIGHTGTLDPMATGLLVLCLGQATRLVEHMSGHDKRYTGLVQLGTTTTTDDAEGEPILTRPVPKLSPAFIESSVDAFRGSILQTPPHFSALKVAGRRAYDLARSGEIPALAPRPITIHNFQAGIASVDTLAIDVACSAGTYIRSLARDLGEALGCGGHLKALRRLSAGPFSVTSAVTLEALADAVRRGTWANFIQPADDGVIDMAAAVVSEEAATIISHGGWWRTESVLHRGSPAARIYSVAGEFIGVGSVSSLGEIRPAKVFKSGKT